MGYRWQVIHLCDAAYMVKVYPSRMYDDPKHATRPAVFYSGLLISLCNSDADLRIELACSLGFDLLPCLDPIGSCTAECTWPSLTHHTLPKRCSPRNVGVTSASR
jgi:hypothetical protein